MYLYIPVFVFTWSSLVMAQERLKLVSDQVQTIGGSPYKCAFCLICVTEHTVFTEEYVFLNCIHTGNMNRWNFRNFSRLITTTDTDSSKCIKHNNKSFVRLLCVPCITGLSTTSVTRWPSECRLSQMVSVNVIKERFCININLRTKWDKNH